MKKIILSILFILTLFAIQSSAYAAGNDLNITDFQNITDYCPYNSTTYTYNCSINVNSGILWDNIYINTTINLPNNHGTYNADSTSIIFETNGKFYSSSNIITSGTSGGCKQNGAGGHAGSITITADKINMTSSLYSNGALCKDRRECNNCNGGGNGGKITLYADEIMIENIYAYGGDGESSGGSAGKGGTIDITTKKLITNKIDVHSGESSVSSGKNGGTIIINSKEITTGDLLLYGGQGDNWGGNGGYIHIVSDIIDAGNIYSYGGEGDDSKSGDGGHGGLVEIASNEIDMGNIYNYGGKGEGYKSGKGGHAGKINISGYDVSLGNIRSYGGHGDGSSNGYAGSIKFNCYRLDTGSINNNGRFREDIIFDIEILDSLGDINTAGSFNLESKNDIELTSSIYAKDKGIFISSDGMLTINDSLTVISRTIDLTADTMQINSDITAYSEKTRSNIYLNAKDLTINSMVNANGNGFLNSNKDGNHGGYIRIVSDSLEINANVEAQGEWGGDEDVCEYQDMVGHGGNGGKIEVYTSESSFIDQINNAYLKVNGGEGAYCYDCDRTPSYHCRCRSGNSGDGGTIHIFSEGKLDMRSSTFDVRGGKAPTYRGRHCDATGHGQPGSDGEKRSGQRKANTGLKIVSDIEDMLTRTGYEGSAELRVIDPDYGNYVPMTRSYNPWAGLSVIGHGTINSLFENGFTISLGKRYLLEMMTSNSSEFDRKACYSGMDECDRYLIEFAEYYR